MYLLTGLVLALVTGALVKHHRAAERLARGAATPAPARHVK